MPSVIFIGFDRYKVKFSISVSMLMLIIKVESITTARLSCNKIQFVAA